MTGGEAAIAMSGQPSPLCSPEQRQECLDRLLAALEADDRIAGVVIVGSGAVGFADCYSDIDLSVVVAVEEDTEPAFREWKQRVEALFDVLWYAEAIYGPNNFLHLFLLDGFLELDMGILSLSNLAARREHWRVAFDRSGEIEQAMRTSWEQRPRRDVPTTYQRRLNSIWHFIMRAAVAVRRGQPWAALHELEQIRNRTVELAGLDTGLENRDFRDMHHMPEAFLSKLEQTLVCSTEPQAILEALKAATRCFFGQAKRLDEAFDLRGAARLEAKMTEYLSAIEAE